MSIASIWSVCRLGSLIAIATLAIGCSREPTGTTPVIEDLESAQVVRVVDGDTIVVLIDGREDRVRYIGIDSPESVKPNSPQECFGPEASDENRRLVDGRTVYLEGDVDDRDNFGRLLRYVFVDAPSGGSRIFVNQALVSGGFAEAVTFRPNTSKQNELDRAEEDAREEERGLWAACDLGDANR